MTPSDRGDGHGGRPTELSAGRGRPDGFLDLGSGIPTVGNVHEVCTFGRPVREVVYVDNDPVAIAHSHALPENNTYAAAIQADLRGRKRRQPCAPAVVSASATCWPSSASTLLDVPRPNTPSAARSARPLPRTTATSRPPLASRPPRSSRPTPLAGASTPRSCRPPHLVPTTTHLGRSDPRRAASAPSPGSVSASDGLSRDLRTYWRGGPTREVVGVRRAR